MIPPLYKGEFRVMGGVTGDHSEFRLIPTDSE